MVQASALLERNVFSGKLKKKTKPKPVIQTQSRTGQAAPIQQRHVPPSALPGLLLSRRTLERQSFSVLSQCYQALACPHLVGLASGVSQIVVGRSQHKLGPKRLGFTGFTGFKLPASGGVFGGVLRKLVRVKLETSTYVPSKAGKSFKKDRAQPTVGLTVFPTALHGIDTILRTRASAAAQQPHSPATPQPRHLKP